MFILWTNMLWALAELIINSHVAQTSRDHCNWQTASHHHPAETGLAIVAFVLRPVGVVDSQVGVSLVV